MFLNQNGLTNASQIQSHRTNALKAEMVHFKSNLQQRYDVATNLSFIYLFPPFPDI